MAKLFTINWSEHTEQTKKGTDTTATNGDILNLLGDPEQILEQRNTLREKQDFTEQEQKIITKKLQKIAKYWEDKIEDPMDPQDDGVYNYSWCVDIITTWERSCKEWKPRLLPKNNGISSKIRNEIFEWYIMSWGIM